MITEAMAMKVLAGIGAYTVAKRTVVPAAKFVGTKVGHGIGKLVNRKAEGRIAELNKMVEVNEQANEQAYLDLMAELDRVFSEKMNTEPDNMIIVANKPEPMFDEKTADWIRKCQTEYGGFANVVL